MLNIVSTKILVYCIYISFSGALLIDEMKLSEGVSFNTKNMQIIGFTDLGKNIPTENDVLGDHGLVFMFQPFQGKWIQTLGCFYQKVVRPEQYYTN